MATKSFIGENRKYPRFPFEDCSWVFSLVLSTERIPHRPIQLEARNISLGGIFFRSNYQYNVFEEVDIQLLSKIKGALPVYIHGRVTRISETDTGQAEKNYSMALEFGPISESDFAKMATILNDVNEATKNHL